MLLAYTWSGLLDCLLLVLILQSFVYVVVDSQFYYIFIQEIIDFLFEDFGFGEYVRQKDISSFSYQLDIFMFLALGYHFSSLDCSYVRFLGLIYELNVGHGKELGYYVCMGKIVQYHINQEKNFLLLSIYRLYLTLQMYFKIMKTLYSKWIIFVHYDCSYQCRSLTKCGS